MKESNQRKAAAYEYQYAKWQAMVWKVIIEQCLKKLYKTLPRQMVAVIQSKGVHTKYQWFNDQFVSIFTSINEVILKGKDFFVKICSNGCSNYQV